MITDTLEGRIKLAYAKGKADNEIAWQENVSLDEVDWILKDSRLLIRITGIATESSVSLIKVVRK